MEGSKMTAVMDLMLIARADFGEGFVVQLYRTGREQYCVSERTTWGTTERLLSVSRERAERTYTEFPERLVKFEEAFPAD
jgi:hypothetical protein